MAETEIKIYNGAYNSGEELDAVLTAAEAHVADDELHLTTSDHTKIGKIDTLETTVTGAVLGLETVASVAATQANAAGKNILQNWIPGLEKNGVVATVNSDGSITLSGTSTKTSSFVLCYDTSDPALSNSYSSKIPVQPGTYVTLGTGDSRVKIQTWGYTDDTDAEAYTNSKDNTEFTVTTKPYISFRIYIAASADFTTPLTIFPMCTRKDVFTIAPNYVPYTPTPEQIAADVADFTRYANPVSVAWSSGYVKPADGTIAAGSDYTYSSLINIRKGQRIEWSSTGPSSISQLTKYTRGVFAGALVDVTENVRLRYLIPHKFWIADEDCQLRICHRVTANGSSIIIPDADVKPVIYNDEQFLSGSPLWKKKMVVFGDSLVYGSRLLGYPTWVTWLAAKYHMTAVNLGINGSSIAEMANVAEGEDDHDPIVDRYQDALREHPDADIVVVEGGANDRTQDVPLGEITSTTKTEFCGAINRIINGTRILCPQSKIFFISLPWRWTSANSLGLKENDYAAAMKAVCEAKSIPSRHPCLDGDIDFRDSAVAAWADEGMWPGVNDPPEANRHYSPAGYQYILPKIERFLSE